MKGDYLKQWKLRSGC